MQLEKSEEKARKREEKYQEQIQLINTKLKQAESRWETGNTEQHHLDISWGSFNHNVPFITLEKITYNC